VSLGAVIEMNLGEAGRLHADGKRPAGPHRPTVDEDTAHLLVQVLLVIVTREDERPSVPVLVGQSVEESVGKAVLVDEDDVRARGKRFEPRDEPREASANSGSVRSRGRGSR
jgi:hypothetical protein